MTGREGPCYWTGEKIEWDNQYEPDGSPDESPLTSVITDLQPGTSPSVNDSFGK